jgi:hypothetical protein
MTNSIYKLPSQLTIEQAQEFADELKQKFQPDITGEVINAEFDASEVSVITTPILQLIIATKKYLQSFGGNLEVINASENFILSANLIGFNQEKQKA